MIGQVFLFWAAATALGVAAWPLVWKLLGRLPDRGYGFMRTAGILLTGYLFWVGGVLGLLPNSTGGVVGAILLLSLLSFWVLSKFQDEFLQWHRKNLALILTMELVFLAAYGFWAFVRANNPDLVATEKPMELAFLNSILVSPRFPPRDPWLSGYSISYYYFGYVMIAMLTRISGLMSGVTFNLANAMWFGLGGVGAYSILYNLLKDQAHAARRLFSLFGPLFVMISGNLEGVLEVLHQRRFFWYTAADGSLTSPFWEWLGIKQLVEPPSGQLGWIPDRYLWWWRASRVVNDVSLTGGEIEVIDEFPFFSFLLADNHPHVLALPFVLMAVVFALNLFYAKRATTRTLSIPFVERFRTGMSLQELVFASVLFGGLAFLNTWDLPIYLTLLMFVVLYQFRREEPVEQLKAIAAAGGVLLLGSALLYLPWLSGFRSQLGGILPNLIHPTRFVQFLIMFGVSIIPVFAWLVIKSVPEWSWKDLRTLIMIGVGIPLFLWILSLGWSGLIHSVLQNNPTRVQELLAGLGASTVEEVSRAVIERRLSYGGTSLFLGFMLSSIWFLYRKHTPVRTDQDENAGVDPFILMMAAVGALLVVGAEFLYLRDLFSTRMNTVFKFYYAAWILWGLSAAWTAASSINRRSWKGRMVFILSVLVLAAGLVFSSLAVWTKTNGFKPAGGRTLDGTAYLEKSSNDYAAIQWMNANLTPGTIAEAIGGSYTQYGRISVHTGFPTVLGWPFHEYQWRGTLDYNGSRETDIQLLYQSRTWEEAEAVIEQYEIRYVYVGSLEKQKYQPMNESKFSLNLNLVYRDDFVSIYEVPGVEVR